jgi:hypothetical protein
MESGARSRPLQLRPFPRLAAEDAHAATHRRRSRVREIYVTAAHPGQVKGNHYHRSATEWFCVIQGPAGLVARDVATGAQEFIVGGGACDRPGSPNVAHAVQNVGEGLMLLLAYADRAVRLREPRRGAPRPVGAAGGGRQRALVRRDPG